MRSRTSLMLELYRLVGFQSSNSLPATTAGLLPSPSKQQVVATADAGAVALLMQVAAVAGQVAHDERQVHFGEVPGSRAPDDLAPSETAAGESDHQAAGRSGQLAHQRPQHRWAVQIGALQHVDRDDQSVASVGVP